MWIARDFDGLWLFRNKPILDCFGGQKFWKDNDDDERYIMKMPSILFPEITFENSPQEVEITKKK